MRLVTRQRKGRGFWAAAVAAAVLMGGAWSAGTAQTWDAGAVAGTVTATLEGGTLTINGTGAIKSGLGSSLGDLKGSVVNVVIENGVTAIGQMAFNGFVNMTSVTISGSVTSIETLAFQGCIGLRSVTIPSSVTYIGLSAFYGCTGLTSVAIPGSVTSIEVQAFYGCTGLTSVAIPSSVTSIGGQAFFGCTGLTSVTIPSSVTSIGVQAFSGCNSLTSIEVASGNANYITEDGVLFNKNKTILILCFKNKQGAYTIPNSVDSIEAQAFYGCTGLTSVAIPNSVKSIGGQAFSGCTGLTSVTIHDGVTSIGGQAFYECTGLTFVTIPSSVTSIGGLAFYGCTGLISIEVAPNNTAYTSENGVLFNKNKTMLIHYPGSKQGAYTIPDGVTTVAYAFTGCVGLTSIIIPSSVATLIGIEGGFSGCTGLTSIEVASDNANYSSEGGVLFNKDKTTVLKYPEGKQGAYILPTGVTSINSLAFRNCTGLTSITIPNSVRATEIGGATDLAGGQFPGCTRLTSIDVASDNPDFVSDNGVVFSKDKTILKAYPAGKVGAYTIPSSVTFIDAAAFSGSTGLTSVTIPNSVTSIGGAAFAGCTGLTSITIPSSVTSIGIQAFVGCTAINSITSLKAAPPEIYSSINVSAFYSLDYASICLYVPESAVESYRAAFGWRDFSCVRPISALAALDHYYEGSGRDIPASIPASSGSVVPVAAAAAHSEFTVGPNPAGKASGVVALFYQGGRIESAALYVYDASGVVVGKINIRDSAAVNTGKRQVGLWNLKDAKGRRVSAGMYLIKGVVNLANGKRDKVSAVAGVGL